MVSLFADQLNGCSGCRGDHHPWLRNQWGRSNERTFGFCSISVFATAKTCIEFQKVGRCLRIPQAVCNHWPVAISTNFPGILAFAAYLGKHHIHPYHGPYPSISGLNTHLHTFTATFDLFFSSSWLNLYFR